MAPRPLPSPPPWQEHTQIASLWCHDNIFPTHAPSPGTLHVGEPTFQRFPGCWSERWHTRKRQVTYFWQLSAHEEIDLSDIRSPGILEPPLTARCVSAACVSMCTRLERVCDRFSRAWLQWARWVRRHCSTRSSSLCTSSRRRCSSSSRASRAALIRAKTCCLFLFAANYGTRGKCLKNVWINDLWSVWSIKDQYVSSRIPPYPCYYYYYLT